MHADEFPPEKRARTGASSGGMKLYRNINIFLFP